MLVEDVEAGGWLTSHKCIGEIFGLQTVLFFFFFSVTKPKESNCVTVCVTAVTDDTNASVGLCKHNEWWWKCTCRIRDSWMIVWK